jgi:hypothetical protein
LLLVEPGRECDLAVGALELVLALRLARNEFELLTGGGEKIGDHRNVRPAGRRLLFRCLGRIDRLGRAGIDRVST